MSYPDNPVLSYSYTGFQQAQGDNTFPGTNLDNDLAVIVAAIAQINAFFANFARSDGKLASGSVTKASLDASLLLGVAPPTNWAASKAYQAGDTVTVVASNKLYVAQVDHTSGAVFATDLTAGKWLLLADFSSFVIADGSVLTSKLADLAVTAAKLAAGAVTSTKIADLAVVTAALADGAVTLAKLADGAVGAAKIANLAVETAKIADLAVSAAKIADGAVTKAKMASVGGQRVLGNAGAGSGPIGELSITNMLDWLSATQGAVLYRGAAGWTALAPGAAGQVLRSNGAAADPSFAAITTGGTVTKVTAGFGLTGGDITGSGTIAMESALGGVGTYAMLRLVSGTATPGTTAGGGNLRYSDADGVTGGSTPVGTWRCMGLANATTNPDTGVTTYSATLWLRTA
jgi:hypothetical protein